HGRRRRAPRDRARHRRPRQLHRAMTGAAVRGSLWGRLLDTGAPRATVLIRVAVGVVFASEGIQKFLYPDALGAGRFGKIGIPAHLRGGGVVAGRDPRTSTHDWMKRAFAIAGSPAFTFVLTMGIVNLFADITYEGGASINGPFLGTLGASAAAISIVAGVG